MALDFSGFSGLRAVPSLAGVGLGGGLGGDYPYTDVLEIGDEGEAISDLQRRLVAAGYSVGSYGIDGKFGPDTQAAVMAAQRALGVTVDGIWGPQTEAAFQAAGGKPQPAPTATPTAIAPRPQPGAPSPSTPRAAKLDLAALAKKPLFWVVVGGGVLLLWYLFASPKAPPTGVRGPGAPEPLLGLEGEEFFRPKKRKKRSKKKRAASKALAGAAPAP
jgi:peptidoglycan hydrolase-like protein with peptidoglycan-binding domain